MPNHYFKNSIAQNRWMLAMLFAMCAVFAFVKGFAPEAPSVCIDPGYFLITGEGVDKHIETVGARSWHCN